MIADRIPDECCLGRESVGGENVRTIFERPCAGLRIFGATTDHTIGGTVEIEDAARVRGRFLRHGDETAARIEVVDVATIGAALGTAGVIERHRVTATRVGTDLLAGAWRE